MSGSTKNLLFIQGGGSKEDYQADQKLVDSLKELLSEAYRLHYPCLPTEPSADLGRLKQIGQEMARMEEQLIVVGHSLGASMLLRYFSENQVTKKPLGLFLLATPFWSGDEEWKEGFKLNDNFADQWPRDIPLFFYHCQDDQEVPFAHFTIYRQKLPWANFRELASGGHQLNNDLTIVANDIRSL
ncbi:alpha/beta hydrolase [Larkinella harenae]